MAKILVVDDDCDLSVMLRDLLLFEHHIVEIVNNGRDAMDRLRASIYDALVLDWELPGLSGVEICRDLRARGDTTPVLMLTGKDAISDKEIGFDAGADDYLTKPFHIKEFSARVKALLRRASALPTSVLRLRNIVLDPSTYQVTKDGQDVQLLPKEFALLEFFMRHPNQVFSWEALLDRVWVSESDAGPEAIRTCITRLRKKVESDNGQPLIKTVHGVGYKLQP